MSDMENLRPHSGGSTNYSLKRFQIVAPFSYLGISRYFPSMHLVSFWPSCESVFLIYISEGTLF